ncbi:hypothetical protein [Succinimonas sp.]|uniref:hypothetical protein n=1 Tax=Succinimonas sp. TaxID=1936151 RepID=UPI0038637EED
MIRLSKLSCNIALAMLAGGVIGVSSLAYALSNDEGNVIRNGQVATKPMNVAGLFVPPSVMLVLGREHNLFAEVTTMLRILTVMVIWIRCMTRQSSMKVFLIRRFAIPITTIQTIFPRLFPMIS